MTTRAIAFPPPRETWPALAWLAVTFGLVAALIIVGVRPTPAAATPDPIVVNATPTLAPPPGLSRPIVAYGAPGGSVIGPIEAGRPYTVVARAGVAWVQLEVAGSGLVWTEASAVDDVDMAVLADLQPPPTPIPPTDAPPVQAPAVWQSAPATAAPEQLYQAAPAIEQQSAVGEKLEDVEDWHPPLTFSNTADDCSDPARWHPPCAPSIGAPAVTGGTMEGQP